MSQPPRNFSDWMRSVDRTLTEVKRSGQAAVSSQIKREIGKVQDSIDGVGDRRTPAAPIELVTQTYVLPDFGGAMVGYIALDFPDVVVASDATPMTVVSYEMWARRTDNVPVNDPMPPMALVTTAEESALTYRGAIPGATYEVAARGFGLSTIRPGLMSETKTVTVIRDTIPPPIPSAFTLTQHLSVVTLEWDGLPSGLGQEMPQDFDYTEYRLRLIDGTFVAPGDRLFGAGNFYDANAPYNVMVYYSHRAVDTSGNKSGWSIEAGISVVPLVDEDSIREALEAASDRIDAVALELSVTGQELTDRLATAEADMVASKARLATAEGTLSNLTGTILPGLTSDLADARAILDPLPGKITATETAIGVEKGRLDTLSNTTIPNLTSDLNAAKVRLTTAEGTLAPLSGRITTAQATADNLKNVTIPALSTQITTEKGRLDTLTTTTLPALQGEVDTAQTDLATAFGELDTVDSRVATAKQAAIDSAATTAQAKADAAEQAAIDAAALVAQAKVDTAKAATLTAAATTAQQKADQAEADAVAAAKTATDLAAAGAQQAAIDAAKLDATSKANAAKVAAEAAAALTAQSKVDTAKAATLTEAAATAQVKATQALTDAKADATTKANKALADAKADAVIKVEAAKQAAITAAAADATSKAEAAEAAAAVTAAADAQEKADAAQAAAIAAAQTYADTEASGAGADALAAAKLDATQKADAAKAAAIAAAALDATAKKEQAEAVAAADAKTKADKALADAKLDATAKSAAAQTAAITAAAQAAQEKFDAAQAEVDRLWASSVRSYSWNGDRMDALSTQRPNASIVNVPDAPASGSVLRKTSGSGTLWWDVSPMPFDPAALYRITFKVRAIVDDSPVFYAGVHAWNASETGGPGQMVSISGAITSSSAHYFAAGSGQVLAAEGWKTFTGYFQGTSPGGAGRQAHDMTNPGAMHPDTRYISPMALLDYINGTGTWDIGMVAIDVIPAELAVMAKQALDDAAAAAVAAGDAHSAAGDAQDQADAALNAATHTGKNLFSESSPSGTAPYGTIWVRTDSSGKAIGSWQQTGGSAPHPTTGLGGVDGSSWTSRPIRSEMIENVDVAKLTASTATIDSAVINKMSVGIATVIKLNASAINAGTISTARLNATTIASAVATIIQLNADRITAGTIDTARLNVTEIAAQAATVINLDASRINSGKIVAGQIDTTNLAASLATIISLNASRITAGTISTARLNATEVAAAVATVIKLNASAINAGTIDTARLNATSVAAAVATVIQLNASRITAGTINTERLNTTAIAAATASIQTVDVKNLFATSATIDTAVVDKLWAEVVNAKKITTDMLLISRGSNTIIDPFLDNPELTALRVAASPGWTSVGHEDGQRSMRLSSTSNDYSVSFTAVGTKSGTTKERESGIDVTTGTQLYASVDVSIGSGRGVQPFYMYVRVWYTDGTTGFQSIRLTGSDGGDPSGSGGFKTYDGSKILGPNANSAPPVKIVAYPGWGSPLSGTGYVWLRNPFMGIRLDASLIVDGGILARHITASESLTAKVAQFLKISAGMLEANSVTSDKINAGAITTVKLASKAITTDKLDADAVDANKIKADAVNASHIKAGAVTAVAVHADAINGMTITGTTLQTTSALKRGVKFTDAGLYAYDSAGQVMLAVDASNGAVTMAGTIRGGGWGEPGVTIYNNIAGGFGALLFDSNTGEAPNDMAAIYQDNSRSLRFRASSSQHLMHFYGTMNFRGPVGFEQRVVIDSSGLATADGYNLRVGGNTTSIGPLITNSYLRAYGTSNTTSAANLYISSGSVIQKVSSASRFKIDPQPMDLPDSLLDDLSMEDWIDKSQVERIEELQAEPAPHSEAVAKELASLTLKRVPGVIAEKVEAAGGDPFVSYGEDGLIEGVAYDRLAMARTEILKRQLGQAMALIESLVGRIELLEA